MTEKIKDALNYKFPMSIVGIVWILSIVLGVWIFASQTFATKSELSTLQAGYERDIKEIKENIQYLIRIQIKK